MGTKKILIITLLVAIFGLVSNCLALSVSIIDASLNRPATPVELGREVNNLVFTGTIKKIPNGTALITKNATYLLTGGNFDSIIGREVNIIGKVIKVGSIERIQVARAQLTQE